MKDNPCSGCRKVQEGVSTPEIINEVHDIVLADHHLKASQIAKAVGILDERVYHIITEDLGITKLSTRRVPQLLTIDQKCMQMQASQQYLHHFKSNPKYLFVDL